MGGHNPGRRRHRRRRPWLWAAGLLALALIAWAILFMSDVGAIRSSAEAARTELRIAVSALSHGETATAVEALAGARAAVNEASDRAGSPVVRLALLVPLLGRDVGVVRQTVAAASEMTAAVEAVGVHLALPHEPAYEPGRFDDTAVGELAAVWREAASLMAAASERMGATPEPRSATVAAAADDVAHRADQGRIATAAISAVLEGVAEASRGGDPFNVLFVLTNGAELRGLTGTPAFTFSADVVGGQVELGQVTPIESDARPAGVAVPADFEALFSEPASRSWWPNLTLSPDGPTVGGLAASTLELDTEVVPSLVVVADLVATGELLGSFPGIRVDGEPVRSITLPTDYFYRVSVDHPSGPDRDGYLAAVLSDLMRQALEADLDLGELISVAGRAAGQGRLTAWSPDDAIQAGLVEARTDHSLTRNDDHTVDIAVQNMVGSKVDMHTRFDARVRFETDAATCRAAGRLELSVIEEAPQNRRRALAGGARANHWWVNAYLPSGATEGPVTADAAPADATVGSWGDRPVVSVETEAPLGGQVDLVFEWSQEIPSSRVVTVNLPTTVRTARWDVSAEVPVPEGCRPSSS